MVPGDHLQYFYYLALVEDMLTGRTPFFYNPYEFNTGDDEARYEPDPYYFPFCGLFTLISLIGNRVLAWNLTGFISLWLSYWVTWRLARRYTESEWFAGTAALMTFALSFRWDNLLGGSPMGLALLWPPLIMYGIDRAVREDRVGDGILAGASILFALWTDMHTFFFGTMFVPVWCVIAFLKRQPFDFRNISAWLKLIRALLPIPLFVLLALGIRRLHTQALAIKDARTWNEAALFSPKPEGLFTSLTGVSGHIYLGYGILVLVVAGLVLALVLALRKRDRESYKDAVVYLALCAALTGAVILALGAFGPLGGRLFDIGRHYIPFYNVIRQPAKIYCLMPPMLAIAAVMTCVFAARLFSRRVVLFAAAGLWVWILVGTHAHVGVGLTSIKPEQFAYKAVSDDAAGRSARPGAMVVPLWPGDSHFSSVYQHFALQYRIRMVNGYTPMDVPGYREKIFRRFVSINQGVLDDGQLDELLERGIPYILLHEDMFPEQVSPYPVGFTLRNLLNNPRLEKIAQDERVWAFRILDEPVARPAVLPDWNVVFSARRWEAEFNTPASMERQKDEKAGRYEFVRLSKPGESMTTPTNTVAGFKDLAWLVRARGHGQFTLTSQIGTTEPSLHEVDSDTWTWLRISTGLETGFAEGTMTLSLASGSIDLDLVVLSAGPWQSPPVGSTASYTAARFFHAGFSDMRDESVVFQTDDDPTSAVFYGPKLPLDAGSYDVAFEFTSPASPGTKLGLINMEQDELTGQGDTIDVIAGQPAVGRLHRKTDLPFNLAFIYLAVDEVRVQRVTFTRIE